MPHPADLGAVASALRDRVEALNAHLAEGELSGAALPSHIAEEIAAALDQLVGAEERLSRVGVELGRARATADTLGLRYRELFHSAPDGYLVTDADAVVRSANRRSGEILGVAPDALRGRPLASLLAPRYLPAFERALDALRRGERVEGLETCLVDGAGAEVTVEITAEPVRSVLGVALGWSWLVRDVTERKRLEQSVLEAEDRERLRLGQELHDDLGQRLVGVLLVAEVVAADLRAGGSALAPRAGRVVELIGGAVESTRTLAHRFAAPDVAACDLPGTLEALVAATQGAGGVGCLFVVEGEPPACGAETSTHLYRIAQEAVSNALRHGSPRHVRIELRVERTEGLLRVLDDGVGFAAGHPEGLGLRSMRLRAGFIGAALDIQRDEQGWTAVECRFPLVSDARAPAPPRGPARSLAPAG